MYTDCFSVCCLQRAMAAEYGSFNTQAVPASVDIMGFSCRHATDISLQCLACSSELVNALYPYEAAVLYPMALPYSSRSAVVLCRYMQLASTCTAVLRSGCHDMYSLCMEGCRQLDVH